MPTDTTIPNGILANLGGRKFVAMTGAKNMVASDSRTLSFRLPGGSGFCKNGINHVTITLDPSDTYTVTFNRIRGTKVVEVAKHSDVYCDMLTAIFKAETGLETSLGTMGR